MRQRLLSHVVQAVAEGIVGQKRDRIHYSVFRFIHETAAAVRRLCDTELVR